MAETLSVSKGTPKIHLPNKDLVGVEPSKKEKDLTDESAKLPHPTGWRILVLPFTPREKTKGGIIIAQESLENLRIATN